MKLPFVSKKKESVPVRRRLPSRDDGQPQPLEQQYSFRRNRTITGSRSSAIASANENDAHLQSPRAIAHSLRRKRRSLGAVLGAVIAVVVLLLVTLHQFTATTTVALYGQVQAIDASETQRYRDIMDEYYGRHPAERLRWLLDTDQLATYMQQRGATEVQSIRDVAPVSFGNTLVTFQMREPLASWRVDGSNQFVDDSGTIFAHNFYNTPKVRILDESGVKRSDNRAVASGRYLSFIGQSVGQLRSYNLQPKNVIIPPDTTRQAQFELDDGIRIKLTVDRPAGEQAEDASRAVAYLRGKQERVEYVDVRVGGKAFYRSKE